jgi:hypothetical protein
MGLARQSLLVVVEIGIIPRHDHSQDCQLFSCGSRRQPLYGLCLTAAALLRLESNFQKIGSGIVFGQQWSSSNVGKGSSTPPINPRRNIEPRNRDRYLNSSPGPASETKSMRCVTPFGRRNRFVRSRCNQRSWYRAPANDLTKTGAIKVVV